MDSLAFFLHLFLGRLINFLLFVALFIFVVGVEYHKVLGLIPNANVKYNPNQHDGALKTNKSFSLPSVVNTKLYQQRFWPCHENGLIKTILMIPLNPNLSYK